MDKELGSQLLEEKRKIVLPARMRHFMLDIETLGMEPDGAIIQIGAVEFSPDLRPCRGDTFSAFVSLESNLDEDRTVNPSTLYWWAKQPKFSSVIDHVEKGTTLESALNGLGLFLSGEGLSKIDAVTPKNNIIVWANGVTFDISMLTHAYKAVIGRVPWSYSNIMDLKPYLFAVYGETSLSKFEIPGVRKATNAHDAISDCYYQIHVVQHLISRLRRE